MANPARIVSANVAGPLFVDETCINCDTCRQLAPTIFGEQDGYSYVQRQPVNQHDERASMHALLSCPTGSIGTTGPNDAKQAGNDFPLPIDGRVYYCGFNSPKSYGGNSYFLRRSTGNWLIDSPKYLKHLARRLEALGGVQRIFLTHRDDVADAERWAAHFGAERVIHRLELSSQPTAERVIDGDDPVELEPGMLAIPTPGHTAGHCVLLVDDHYLFTGDHLWWDRDDDRLGASKTYCWNSWGRQKQSMKRLRDFRFEWVLAGHGDRVHYPLDRMKQELDALIDRMDQA